MSPRGATAAGRRWLRATVAAWVLLLTAATVASAQGPDPDAAGQVLQRPFSLGEVFTFLFLTLGPTKVVHPFSAMTRGRDAGFKRRLALEASVIALLTSLVAATIGATILRNWGISVGALLLAAGIILFLVAVQHVLGTYAPAGPEPETSGSAGGPAPPTSALAFSPLAVPTIVTPYGIAVLILLATLRPEHLLEILGLTVAVLGLDLLAMLFAGHMMKRPLITVGLRVLEAVLGVLQVALGVQAAVDGLHLMGVV